MPSIYRVEFSDEPAAAAPQIVPAEYQALLVGEQIVPLPHPAERRTIHEHGESFLSASLKGTYLRVTLRLCMQCGRLIEAPQISFGAPGCLPSVLIAIASGCYLAMQPTWEVFEAVQVALSVLCGTLLFTTLSGLAYAKLVWRGRQKKISRYACPDCGSKVLRSIVSLSGQTVPLDDQSRSVSVEVAGRS